MIDRRMRRRPNSHIHSHDNSKKLNTISVFYVFGRTWIVSKPRRQIKIGFSRRGEENADLRAEDGLQRKTENFGFEMGVFICEVVRNARVRAFLG